VGAKGLTGEFYNGHAFWDSEIYCLPYYLFTDPLAARSLLEYRYNTLEQAKQRARMIDCKGACYPVATLNGEEGCTLWQHANLQFQTNTAIAYGIEHYVKVTGDKEFLYKYGCEMLVEICRFLDSRGAYGQRTGEFGFFGVMGPDEFHMMVSNDCYTNYMAKAAFEYALEALGVMRESEPEAYGRLLSRIHLDADEPQRWKRHASSMRIPADEKTGVFEQHDGFFDLPRTDIGSIPAGDFPLYHNWSYDRIYRSDMIKQVSVLLLFLLHGSRFDYHTKKVNYEYYEPRTIHESSLSPSVHSILACELGKTDDAMRLFRYATRLDLDNYNRNTHEGLHTTSLAGAWANIVYGFAGMRSDGDVISFAPMLPPDWEGYRIKLNIRGSSVAVSVGKEGCAFRIEQGEPAELEIYGKRCIIGEEPASFGFDNPNVEKAMYSIQ
jgi:maltose phosphorylase